MKGIPSYEDGGASSTAEAGTLQLEMKYLSQLTGNEVYWRKAEKVMQVLDDNGMEDGLLPIYVNADTGKFTTSTIRLGSRGDSYYGKFSINCVYVYCYLFINTFQSTSSSNTCRLRARSLSIRNCGLKPSRVSKNIWSPRRSTPNFNLLPNYQGALVIPYHRRWITSCATYPVPLPWVPLAASQRLKHETNLDGVARRSIKCSLRENS